MSRPWQWATLAIVLATGLTGCTGQQVATRSAEHTAVVDASPAATPTPSATPTPTPSPTPARSATATFVAVIDGDTISTSAGTVRIAGIDTPEQGECGHDEASTAIGRLLVPGDTVTLELTPGQNDRDQHDRRVRSVTTEAGVDLGLMQLQSGNAVARYDSTDGYPAHPHEDAYHAAQLATLGADGTVLTTTCQQQATTQPVPFTDQPAGDPWWEQYSSCTKLKKNSAGHPQGPFRRDHPDEAEIYNWFAYGTGNRGDGDNDGLACE